MSSLLYDRLSVIYIFPKVLRGGENKIYVIEEFLVLFFRVFIANLPCHVVTLKSAVLVSYGCSI